MAPVLTCRAINGIECEIFQLREDSTLAVKEYYILKVDVVGRIGLN